MRGSGKWSEKGKEGGRRLRKKNETEKDRQIERQTNRQRMDRQTDSRETGRERVRFDLKCLSQNRLHSLQKSVRCSSIYPSGERLLHTVRCVYAVGAAL